MLTEQDFKEIEKEASKLYLGLEDEIIKEISERIAEVGYMNTVAYNNVKILEEMGVLYDDIIALVAEYNENSVKEIQDIFEEAGLKTLKKDDSIYKKAGLNPYGFSESMQQVLSATIVNTQRNLSNLTRTTAMTSQNEFINAINQAYLEVTTGVKSYSQAIIDATNKVAEKGAYIQYPSGAKRSIESAVRTNIVTSTNQMSGTLQMMRAEEMNWDLMELSAHSGARPEHAEWQGKIVSLSGKKGYLSLKDIGYGTPTGFQGVNCRHTWYPYYKGSTFTYTSNELKNLRNEIVSYNGKKISKYDATQIQRRMERQIRQDKKDISAMQGILLSNNTSLHDDAEKQLKQKENLLKVHNTNLNGFLKQTKLIKDRTRLI